MHGMELSSARRRAPLALISLTVFMLLLPLTLTKPGLPIVTKADEAAYYLAALSLWHDGDMVCEDHDARRLFREYAGTNNLLLMSRGRDLPTYFSVPVIYPLVATPFVGLFGANGMVTLNAGLLMAMVWMGFAYLRKHNGESLSALFAASYFLLSTAFVYVFWLQSEVFTMACVTASFFLVDRGTGGRAGGRRPRRLALHAAGAGAMLATACYSKPMLVALALPMLYLLARPEGGGPRRPSWRALAAFAASAVLTMVALAGTARALTGEIWPYFPPRMGVSLSSPIDYVERRVDPRFPRRAPQGDVNVGASGASPAEAVLRAGRGILFALGPRALATAPDFLFGRHGGFVVYMPFAVLAVLFFFLAGRRSAFGWLILIATVLTAALFVTAVQGQWLGGGGFIGNRYFSAAYPSFLFMVRRLRPPWLIALGFAAAAVFLGPLLITPLGARVNEPTLQAHVRNQPYPRLPLEWELGRILPGYRNLSHGGVAYHGRNDELVGVREEVWIHGAKRVDLHLLSPLERQSFVFDVRNLAPDNTIEICIEGDCRQLAFEQVPPAGSTRRVTFEPRRGRVTSQSGRPGEPYRYRMSVTTQWGEQPRWRGSGEEKFYLGAALVYLGTAEDLAREVHHVEWLAVGAPPRVAAGGTFAVPVKLRNAGPHVWRRAGGTRVAAAYHWLDEDGEPVVWEGRRTALPADVPAGGEVEMEILVDAPEAAGRYLLVLDLLRERVAWFSALDEARAYRVPVTAVAAAGAAPAGGAPGSGP